MIETAKSISKNLQIFAYGAIDTSSPVSHFCSGKREVHQMEVHQKLNIEILQKTTDGLNLTPLNYFVKTIETKVFFNLKSSYMS